MAGRDRTVPPRRAARVGRLAAPRSRKRALPTVADLLAALDRVAPLRLASDWDNVGLIAGRPDWAATRVLLAIDLTDAVAAEALRREAQAVVAYHPPIFKGIRTITPAAAAPTTMLPDLLAARVAVLSVHTALDAAVGGTNDVLLDRLDVTGRRPLEAHVADGVTCKLVTFAPAGVIAALRAALSEAGAGEIGHYAECSFELTGQGTFRGDQTTRPAVGQSGRLERVDEVRLEMVVPRERLAGVVRALYRAHPYEEPAFDIYPLRELPGRAAVGLGRVGRLRRPSTGTALVERLRAAVDLSAATFVGDLRRRFTTVTAAAGAFGPRSFRDADSLVVTGELKHHEALELLARGVTAVCLGHYASERPALDDLCGRLASMLRGSRVSVARSDAAPLRALR